jgi:hypothetical protein
MPTFVHSVVSRPVLLLLGQLRSGISSSALAQLPKRQRELVARLEKDGHVLREQAAAGARLLLAPALRGLVEPTASGPRRTGVTRAQLDALDLPQVRPFHIGQLPRPMGRSLIPAPRIYLKELPSWDWDPTTDLDETALALLVFAPAACAQLVRAHPRRKWEHFIARIRAEGLEARARYFGIKKLIGMRKSRTPRVTRHDAVRRAKTEPIPKRRRRP